MLFCLDRVEHRISIGFNCDLTEKGINFISARELDGCSCIYIHSSSKYMVVLMETYSN